MTDLDYLKKFRYAHRGFHDKPLIPENSIAAFERAAQRGWGAELDVHLSGDGRLMVFHDSLLHRTTGEDGIIEEKSSGVLREYRLEESDEKIPFFDEVLDIFESAGPLIIEFKTYKGNSKELAEAVCKRLDSYKGAFCVESFDPRAMGAVASLRPGMIRGQLATDFFRETTDIPFYQKLLLTNLMLNGISKPHFIAYEYKYRDNKALQRAVKNGAAEFSWTVRSKEDMLRLEAAGSVCIFEQFDPEETDGNAKG